MPTWETDTDWDNATAEDGVEHESVANTANDDATSVEQGYTYTNYQVTPAPVAHYPLQETSGTTATDVAETNDGTYNGATPDGATGPLGVPAISCDGTDDWVDCGFDTHYSEGGQFLWVRPDNFDDSPLIGNGGAGEQERLKLLADGTVRHQRQSGGTSQTVDSTTSLTAGQWWFVGGTWSDTAEEIDVYVNGVQEATTPYSAGLPGASDGWRIARQTRDASTDFFSALDAADYRIYDHRPTEQEVSALYDVVAAQSSLTTAYKTL